VSSNIKQQVRAFIVDNFLMGSAAEFADDASFMDNHFIDSTGFLELISFIEEEFHFRVEDNEMLPENFDSLDNVERYVRLKGVSAA
jgi:acyl carrier protein